MPSAVKICGLTTAEALDAALEAGTDYVGLVFFTKSPRNVDTATATALAARARGRSQIVVLVVDPSDEALDHIVHEVRPDIIQLHGDESLTRVADIKFRYGLAVWKAIPVSSAADIVAADPYAVVADRVLFDAKPPHGSTLPGGNGVTFDWSLLDGVAARFPFVLSGGLTPETVADAIAATHASIVDVSSGVESAPGIKDAALITRFIRSAKASRVVHA
ncbi:MAG: phosphoribosylanthranilate isomerase [Hyphomicrobium sp.]